VSDRLSSARNKTLWDHSSTYTKLPRRHIRAAGKPIQIHTAARAGALAGEGKLPVIGARRNRGEHTAEVLVHGPPAVAGQAADLVVGSIAVDGANQAGAVPWGCRRRGDERGEDGEGDSRGGAHGAGHEGADMDRWLCEDSRCCWLVSAGGRRDDS
jgi:hypothetical protein